MPYSSPSFLLLGFHGCERAVGERLLAGEINHLSPSQNAYDWLGDGIYFWEDNPQRAFEWAQSGRSAVGQLEDPFVIGACIDPGNCLNLMEAESIAFLKQAYSALLKTQAVAHLPKNTPRLRHLDCLVVNTATEIAKRAGYPYDTVRGVFIEGEAPYPGAEFKDKTHVQLCVRNPAAVRGYFRPLPEHWGS